MSNPIRFIGNYDVTSEGKFLWEILTQLKSMGVGRCVTKTEWINKWPAETSFVRIVKARPEMDRWLQGGRMWGEWTFRSRYLGIYEFSKDLNRSDWRLIHKHEEPKMTECHNRTMPLLKVNDSFPLPPLQRFLTQMSTRAKGQTKERATLDLSIDPQFEMIKKFIEKTSPTKKAESPYEETVPETFLSLYGNILPVKVDSWSLDPANYRYHFDTKDNKK